MPKQATYCIGGDGAVRWVTKRERGAGRRPLVAGAIERAGDYAGPAQEPLFSSGGRERPSALSRRPAGVPASAPLPARPASRRRAVLYARAAAASSNAMELPVT